MREVPSVRSRLVGLVLACVLPTVALATAAIAYVYQQERQAFERSLSEAGRALAQVVDTELAAREAVLRTLANSPALTARNLELFHAYARGVAPTHDRAIVLADLAGQQLLNSRRAFGETLPQTVFGEMRRREPLATLVSDVYFAPIGRQYSFAVEVPVVRDGRPIYYLSMGSFASDMQQLLDRQKLPAGWIGSIVDRRGAVVARTMNAGRFISQRPNPGALAEAERRHGVVLRLESLEGAPLLGALSRSPVSGWGFFIGVPEAQVTSPVRTAATLALIALAAIAGSVLVALRFGQSLAGPITQLAAGAEALGRGEVPSPAPTGLRETDAVAGALVGAGTAIRTTSAQLEERVQQALLEAEKAQRALIRHQRMEAVGQLTGGVAHDFNNLLMVVATNTHLLQRRAGLGDDPQLARIQRAVDTGTRLTRQLLAFSRRQPLRPQVLQLAEVLPELMQLVRPSLTSTVQVACEVAPGTPAVCVDPAEFELAIINLAVNARDAMPQGGRFTLRAGPAAAPADAPGATVLVEVEDTGSGIPAALLDKVFEPFFTTKEVGRGTGLGLSQVYGMVSQAGGAAQITSEPGRGTTVRLYLPPAPATASAAPDSQAAPETVRASVLLVEDNAEVAEVTRELLLQAGCRVQWAASADAALALLEGDDRLPDVVLSDIRMPGALDGLALARRLRQAHPSLPVVLMTGYSGELQAARELALPVLAKPVRPAELLAALQAAKDGAQAPRSAPAP